MDFQKDIIISMFEEDVKFTHQYDMELIKNNITKKNRLLLINWIFGVCEEFNIESSILQESIILMDKYLQKKQLNTGLYQLLALTCLYLQLKMNSQQNLVDSFQSQGYIIKQELSFDWCVEQTEDQYSKDQFRQMEIEIMNTMEGKINICSPIAMIHGILNLFLMNFRQDVQQVETISCICLQNYDQIQSMNSRVITFSTLYFYFLKFQKQDFPQINSFLQQFSQYVEQEDIQICLNYLDSQWSQADIQDTLDQVLQKKSNTASPVPSCSNSQNTLQNYQQNIDTHDMYQQQTIKKTYNQNTHSNYYNEAQTQKRQEKYIQEMLDSKETLGIKQIQQFDDDFSEEISGQNKEEIILESEENNEDSDDSIKISFDRHIIENGSKVQNEVPSIQRKTISKDEKPNKAGASQQKYRIEIQNTNAFNDFNDSKFKKVQKHSPSHMNNRTRLNRRCKNN